MPLQQTQLMKQKMIRLCSMSGLRHLMNRQKMIRALILVQMQVKIPLRMIWQVPGNQL